MVRKLHPEMVKWNRATVNYMSSVGVTMKVALQHLKAGKEQDRTFIDQWAYGGSGKAAPKSPKAKKPSSCVGRSKSKCPTKKCVPVSKSKTGARSHCRSRPSSQAGGTYHKDMSFADLLKAAAEYGDLGQEIPQISQDTLRMIQQANKKASSTKKTTRKPRKISYI